MIDFRPCVVLCVRACVRAGGFPLALAPPSLHRRSTDTEWPPPPPISIRPVGHLVSGVDARAPRTHTHVTCARRTCKVQYIIIIYNLLYVYKASGGHSYARAHLWSINLAVTDALQVVSANR